MKRVSNEKGSEGIPLKTSEKVNKRLVRMKGRGVVGGLKTIKQGNKTNHNHKPELSPIKVGHKLQQNHRLNQ